MKQNKFSLLKGLFMAAIALPLAFGLVYAGPGAVPDAPLYPNGRPTYYANSPSGNISIMNPANGTTAVTSSGTALSKFVDSLAGMGLPGCVTGNPAAANPCHENNLGNYIPIATPDTGTFSGSDYYVLGMADYRQRMHSNLLAPVDALGTGVKLRGYHEIIGGVPQPNHYLGPVILATKDKPVRVQLKNTLGPSNTTGKLFIPVDPTVMGAGNGPNGQPYAENRATLHLHGGHSPWISDGTPHQWITPALDPTTLPKGDSFQNVPDMVGAGKPIVTADPTDGLATFFWTNQQSGRFMFYHDHAYGLTRLNVYAGEAAGYLIVDPQESVMMAAGTLPNICDPSVNGGLCAYIYGIPLVIQDKSFVPANVGGTLSATGQDTLWNLANWGGEGNLWFPHIYEPNQDLTEPSGLSPSGRWDYGPYVWPPSPVTNTTLPTVSLTPEAFMDTPIVNGTAYPYLPVEKKAYRFRILSAANDRSFNLQLYYGATAAGVVCNDAVIPVAYATCTEVKMVPAVATGGFPASWPTDNRDGGVPDPATAGPQMLLIGTESGFLPAPVVLPNQPITYDGVGNIGNKTLLVMPAERADIIIDFTNAPLGSTIILYNDAPAALPGGDPRYDYYTGNPDQTTAGGAPSTVAGLGPNTRTVMQFRVTTAANTAPVVTATNLAGLSAAAPAVGALATAYTASQPAHIVPATQYAKLTDTSMTIGRTLVSFKGKSINEGFDSTYGRINAMLGTEDPSGLNPSVPLEYIAPATETVGNDQVQLWKITHNGVDSHPIHFHLTDVQVVNRIGWDGSILAPDPSELGWKETVRMNPLEEVIIAMRPTAPTLPFTIPDSIRRLDVTQPVSATNPLTNFGHEYVWHCHILGHEEFDLMRPLVLNPNAKVDMLWRNTATGQVVDYTMDGTNILGGAIVATVDPAWTIVGRGDFNSDGKPDILWRNPTTGQNAVYYMDGVTILSGALIPTVDPAWTIAGTGDFNGDGKPDILWRNPTTGQNVVYYMNGVTILSGVYLPTVDPAWTVGAIIDYNSDGKPDIIWRNPTTGQNAVYYMDGVTILSGALLPTEADLTWTIAGAGDFNYDVKPDILWRNTTSGDNRVWYMDGVTQTGSAAIANIPVAWQIVGY